MSGISNDDECVLPILIFGASFTDMEYRMYPQIHAAFDVMAILALAIGLHFRLRQHPLYKLELLMNGIIYVVWAGIILAWLPNLAVPLRSLVASDPVPVDWWRVGLDNWILGLTGGLIAGYIYIRCNRLPLWFVFDRAAPLLALTLAIWRIGCAVNGDAYGKVTDSWVGVWLPDVNGVYAVRYPTQYVSIVANLLIAFLLLILEWYALRQPDRPMRWSFPGFYFWGYIGLYCVQRFLFEFWRGDKPTLYQLFTLTHVYCLIGIALSLWNLGHGWRNAQKKLSWPNSDWSA